MGAADLERRLDWKWVLLLDGELDLLFILFILFRESVFRYWALGEPLSLSAWDQALYDTLF